MPRSADTHHLARMSIHMPQMFHIISQKLKTCSLSI